MSKPRWKPVMMETERIRMDVSTVVSRPPVVMALFKRGRKAVTTVTRWKWTAVTGTVSLPGVATALLAPTSPWITQIMNVATTATGPMATSACPTANRLAAATV